MLANGQVLAIPMSLNADRDHAGASEVLVQQLERLWHATKVDDRLLLLLSMSVVELSEVLVSLQLLDHLVGKLQIN